MAAAVSILVEQGAQFIFCLFERVALCPVEIVARPFDGKGEHAH